ncbi:MAG: hypothetical protein AB8F78_03780 [Saprospiraceae bacterium]
MYTRFRYFAIIVLCGFLTPFCTTDDDNCGPSGPSYFDIEGIRLERVEDGFITIRSNLSQDATLLNFRRTEDIVLELSYLLSYVNNHRSQPSMSQFLTPQLLACSPVFGGNGSKEERHAGVTVTTVFDHSIDYPAGSTLNSEVLVGDFPFSKINSPLDSLARDTSLIQGLGLTLQVPSPTMADTMQLKIELNLDTGEAYELLTPRLVYTQ